jgi:plasmid stabilization system protein ParE
MTRIVWSEQSKADLKAIRAYIADDSRVYAQRVTQRARRAVEKVSIQAEHDTGIRLRGAYAMLPSASVSGLYFAHRG